MPAECPPWSRNFAVRAITATVCLTAALLAASAGESRADFRVCNQTGAQVKLAFGHNDTRFGWTSRGWWTLPSGGCQMVLYGAIPRGLYYVYTLDAENRAISVPEAQTGGTFCLKDENFELRSSGYMTPQNNIACEASGLKGGKFRAVEVTEPIETYTHSLVPNTMGVGISALLPLIKEAAQNLERPASPPTVTPSPQVSVIPSPTVQRPAPPVGTACQRYPNLC
jgi:uncharacterized membrane protein